MVPVNLSSVWLAGNDIFLLYALKDFLSRGSFDNVARYSVVVPESIIFAAAGAG